MAVATIIKNIPNIQLWNSTCNTLFYAALAGFIPYCISWPILRELYKPFKKPVFELLLFGLILQTIGYKQFYGTSISMPILWGIGAIMSGYGILGIIEHIQQKEGLNSQKLITMSNNGKNI